MSEHDYYRDLIARRRILREHGLGDRPSDEDLIDHMLALSDRLDAVCELLGVTAEQDVRGRWRARRVPKRRAV